jgi:uncharacterized RDD family membrane protein YckC
LSAKLIDAGIVCLIVGAVAAVLWLSAGSRVLGPDVFPWLPVVCGSAQFSAMPGYTIFAEYHYGRTIGKKLMGSGSCRNQARGLRSGKAALRQLPFFFQFFFIDALFAPVHGEAATRLRAAHEDSGGGGAPRAYAADVATFPGFSPSGGHLLYAARARSS